MPKTTKLKLFPGDLFRFDIGFNAFGCGQILISSTLHYIVIFEPMFFGKPNKREISASNPLLSGWTMDGRFFSGHWRVIEHSTPIGSIKYPEYKVEISGKAWVTDSEGNAIRPASSTEEENLQYQKSFSPIAFEKAFRAHHGELPWEERFNELRANIK